MFPRPKDNVLGPTYSVAKTWYVITNELRVKQIKYGNAKFPNGKTPILNWPSTSQSSNNKI